MLFINWKDVQNNNFKLIKSYSVTQEKLMKLNLDTAAFKAAQSDADIASVRNLREMELRLESKIDKVTADLKDDLKKWMAGYLIAQAAVIVTLVKLL